MEPKEELRKMKEDVITVLDTFQNYPSMMQLQKWFRDAQEGKK